MGARAVVPLGGILLIMLRAWCGWIGAKFLYISRSQMSMSGSGISSFNDSDASLKGCWRVESNSLPERK